MKIKLTKIENILFNIKNKSKFSKIPKPIIILNSNISNIIGDNVIYISEFVIAKIKGLIPELDGHPEITDEIFISLINIIQFPQEILKDTRANNKYLFIISRPFIEVVIEIKRIESGKTEINTMHKINIEELKRLERKFPAVL